jgi:hypothetical protein
LKKETIKQYTILYQYILLLKEPTYIFLIQVFQHLSPVAWWDDFIAPVLQCEDKGYGPSCTVHPLKAADAAGGVRLLDYEGALAS